jgi:hypothetical protein
VIIGAMLRRRAEPDRRPEEPSHLQCILGTDGQVDRAVTSKLDVRDVAARLPEESDELEPLDDADAAADDEADLDAAPEEAEA